MKRSRFVFSMVARIKMSKREWMAHGGLSNPRCYRKQVGRSWAYYMTW